MLFVDQNVFSIVSRNLKILVHVVVAGIQNYLSLILRTITCIQYHTILKGRTYSVASLFLGNQAHRFNEPNLIQHIFQIRLFFWEYSNLVLIFTSTASSIHDSPRAIDKHEGIFILEFIILAWLKLPYFLILFF